MRIKCRNIFFNIETLKKVFSFAVLLLLTACDFDGGDTANINNHSNCWQASLIRTFNPSLQNLYTQAATNASESGASIIALGFAIWMGFRILKMIASFKEESVGEVLSEILQKVTLCAACAYFISSAGQVFELFNLIVKPIFTTFLDLATQNLDLSATKNSITFDGELGSVSFNAQKSCAVNVSDASNLEGIVTGVACGVCQLSARLNSGIHLGIKLMSTGGIGNILVGIIIMVIFLFAKLGFVLYFIDSIFVLCFAAVLFPLGIIAYPFKMTRKWANFAFLMFINSSAIVFFVSLLSTILLISIEGVFEGQSPVSGSQLLSILFLALITFNAPGLGVSLADKFVGGGKSSEFAQKVSKFVMMVAKKAAYAAMDTIGMGTVSAIGNTMDKYEKTRAIHEKARDMKQAVSDKISHLAGYEDNE